MTATDILCECDQTYDAARRYEWCGRERTDADRIANEASEAERRAAQALTPGKRGLRALIMAISGLDSEAGRDISAYSNLAAQTVDAEDYAVCRAADRTASRDVIRERAERRHGRRELAALETMVRPMPRWSALRRRIVAALRELHGVTFGGGHATSDPDNPCVYCAREYRTMLQSWDTLRNYPELPEHDRLKADMLAARLLRA